MVRATLLGTALLLAGAALILPAGAQVRVTPMAAKGGEKQGEPWSKVPESFRKIKIPDWPLPTDLKRWQKKDRANTRATLLDCLGEMPPRPDPRKVRILSEEDKGDYLQQRFEFDNGVDSTVPGILLLPKNLKGRAPTILALHGHGSSKESVCTDAANQQLVGPNLARKGYIVAAIDGYFNGERIGKGPAGFTEDKAGQEATLFKLNLWQGRTLWGMMLRDEQCLLDYLETRPEVDKNRIGATGMSMGCTRAWWLAAVDERVKAIVGVACFTRYTELIRHGNIRYHGIYYFVPGLLKHFDTEAIYALVAPRPMLMLSGDQDGGAPTDGVETLERKLSAVYDLYGKKPDFRSVVYKNTGHEYLPEMHEEMLAWFQRHLPTSGAVARCGAEAPESQTWEKWLDLRLSADDTQRMMQSFVERHLVPIEQPKRRTGWEKRRASLRRQILKLTGLDDLLPPKWDLNLTHKGTLRRDGYRIEKITFETYPGFANAALLYVPDNVQGRAPGIVSISGHTTESKAADYVQQRNVNLVKRGCVVLSYDYLGFNERTPGGRPEGANSHGIRSFSYTRRGPTTLEILDAWRAIDVLCARPDVDPKRIGFTGESGGSNSTYWIAALDPRVKLAVPVSSVTTFDYWIRGDINWDWHQRPPGIRRIADIGKLLALHAPDPLVIITSKRRTDDEEFPWEEAEKSHQWARQVYGQYGAKDRIQHYESVTGHGYQEDKREQLYLAVERWLKPPHPNKGKELTVQVETAEALHCGLPANNKTFRSIYSEWLDPLPRTSKSFNSAELRAFLRERLGWPGKLPEVSTPWPTEFEAGLDRKGAFLSIDTEPGIALPAMLLLQAGETGRSVTLAPGRDKAAISRALERGESVLAFDLRGIGETKAGKGGLWTAMAGEPWPALLGDFGASWTNWSWFAGRPVTGQWALDIRQAARLCRTFGFGPISVDAQNEFGWPALLAAAAEPDLIQAGHVRLGRRSLREDLVARGDRALSDVPGLLERLDIPQLRNLCPKVAVVE